MKNYEENVKLLYKILSHIYDLMDLFIFPNKKNNPRKGLANHLPNKPLEVLDVCCGTGNSSLAIAKKNPRNEVIGIDLSKDMLKVAGNKAVRNEISNISFLEMNATLMDFKDDSFDVVTVSLAFHEMPGELIVSILSEMYRVLKPGGNLYIIDWEKPSHPFSLALFTVFPTLFEPKGFKKFLKFNWSLLLQDCRFTYIATESYTFTKLITAIK